MHECFPYVVSGLPPLPVVSSISAPLVIAEGDPLEGPLEFSTSIWIEMHFTPEEIETADAAFDLDHDFARVATAVAYGTLPDPRDPLDLPRIRVFIEDGFLHVAYPRRSGGTGTPGIDHSVAGQVVRVQSDRYVAETQVDLVLPLDNLSRWLAGGLETGIPCEHPRLGRTGRVATSMVVTSPDDQESFAVTGVAPGILPEGALELKVASSTSRQQLLHQNHAGGFIGPRSVQRIEGLQDRRDLHNFTLRWILVSPMP